MTISSINLDATGIMHKSRHKLHHRCHKKKRKIATHAIESIAFAGQVITSFGRPDWPKVVSGVADNHPGQTVGVFVCGPPPFCKSINAACQTFNATAAARIKVRSETSGHVHYRRIYMEMCINHSSAPN
jgi:Ferric reductase NAD binding domain